MKLQGLTTIGFILILASKSKGKEAWSVNVTKNYQLKPGSSIIIQCTFIYPEKYHSKDVRVYWKNINKKGVCTEKDNDKRAFIWHANDSCVEGDYRGRTELLGDPSKGNCTLLIKNVTKNDNGIYMRLYAKGEQYSFLDNSVSITKNDTRGAAVTSFPHQRTVMTEEPKRDSTNMYVAISVPVAASVVILLVAGILLIIKYKRSKPFTREDSGYYANFSRTTPHPPKSDALSTKQEQKKNEPKVIDEPVYINIQDPTVETHQNTHHMDHVYGNVDYSK